uniref:Probable RNA polymerase II nuclear localization protein SLC7A6OS n=1 Tax=Syphacia muris TaxID=451379 RepID=A0A0N5AHD2_9BILA
MASAAEPLCFNVFRVRRKRNAHPLKALMVSVKRPRNEGVNAFCDLLYQHVTTSEVPDVTTIGEIGPANQLNFIDFDPSSANTLPSRHEEEGDEETKALGLLSLHAPDERGSIMESSEGSKNCEREISSDDYVFDFYWNARDFDCNKDEYLIRPVDSSEFELLVPDDEESSAEADDDDDSNREDYYLNDYPDEDSDREDGNWLNGYDDDDSDRECYGLSYYHDDDDDICLARFNGSPVWPTNKSFYCGSSDSSSDDCGRLDSSSGDCYGSY